MHCLEDNAIAIHHSNKNLRCQITNFNKLFCLTKQFVRSISHHHNVHFRVSSCESSKQSTLNQRTIKLPKVELGQNAHVDFWVTFQISWNPFHQLSLQFFFRLIRQWETVITPVDNNQEISKISMPHLTFFIARGQFSAGDVLAV